MKGLYLMLFFYSAQLMDSFTTYFALTNMGFREINPVVSSLIHQFGIFETLGLKLLLSLVFIAFYFYTVKKEHLFKWPMEKSLQITGIGTLIIALWNILGMLSVRLYTMI